jgi:hypothetical protein
MYYAMEKLQLFREKTSNNKAVIWLKYMSSHFYVKQFITGLIDDLDMLWHQHASFSVSVKKAVNGFDTAIYTK